MSRALVGGEITLFDSGGNPLLDVKRNQVGEWTVHLYTSNGHDEARDTTVESMKALARFMAFHNQGGVS